MAVAEQEGVKLESEDAGKIRCNLVMVDGEFQEFLNSRDNKKTKETEKFGMRVFEAYLESQGMNLDTVLTDLSQGALDEIIAQFYPSARTKRGAYYSKSSIMLIRFSLARYVMKLKKVDITDSLQFPKACMSFKASVKKLEMEGKAATKHYDPISDEDMRKIQASLDMDHNVGLQRKVFIDMMLYFCNTNRGRDSLRLLQPSDFIFLKSDDGREYVELCDMETTNHRFDNGCRQGGQMFEIPGHPRCPVKSLKKYLSKLNPAIDVLFQRPTAKFVEQSPTWYDNAVLGVNKIGTLMKDISEEAGCTTVYTNHCLRATAVSKADSLKYAEIIKMAGYMPEDCFAHYSTRPITNERNIKDQSSHSQTGKRSIDEEDKKEEDVSSASTSTINTLNQDEEGLFAATVGAKLRSLPPKKKAKAQVKIMETLFQIEWESD
ncbi:uncharacterized protein LOC117112594 [Anneissia japonica]|uniref:uncharacterized protein LOC117112594 n=1 Tax=Anneissia japonica TaxID=1529436 RepID=UPI0014256E8C|nr:uncharacterized protein LOC117112594 [Anneissia japonica]